MMLDTVEGLRALHVSFLAFLESDAESALFQAETSGSPAPYDEFLCGLRVSKSSAQSLLMMTADRWLELKASQHDLLSFAALFVGLEDGDHQHWYGMPMSLIIEADESWTHADEH